MKWNWLILVQLDLSYMCDDLNLFNSYCTSLPLLVCVCVCARLCAEFKHIKYGGQPSIIRNSTSHIKDCCSLGSFFPLLFSPLEICVCVCTAVSIATADRLNYDFRPQSEKKLHFSSISLQPHQVAMIGLCNSRATIISTHTHNLSLCVWKNGDTNERERLCEVVIPSKPTLVRSLSLSLSLSLISRSPTWRLQACTTSTDCIEQLSMWNKFRSFSCSLQLLLLLLLPCRAVHSS